MGSGSSDHRVGDEDGAFVLVLSTNAKAVADTIGEMTDNDALTKAFNRLLRKDDIAAAEKLVSGMSARKDDAQRNYENIDHAVFDLKEQMPSADRRGYGSRPSASSPPWPRRWARRIRSPPSMRRRTG